MNELCAHVVIYTIAVLQIYVSISSYTSIIYYTHRFSHCHWNHSNKWTLASVVQKQRHIHNTQKLYQIHIKVVIVIKNTLGACFIFGRLYVSVTNRRDGKKRNWCKQMAPCQTLSACGIASQVYCDVSSRDKLSIWMSNPLTRSLLCQTHFSICVFVSDEILIYNGIFIALAHFYHDYARLHFEWKIDNFQWRNKRFICSLHVNN